ncbi:hypothetical protein NG821_00820 [Prevotella cerevisiae]|uniref:Uncharacterized protein n=1 Tax=Segatella cerevisiae TaxID=2053716 RepID=A0ABT1BTJ2_9BACT|nr:hypothetical protein [Segatella cerevisiae]MCO6024398.1 hypothetical protein [Segatella cerevisiae]
MKKILLSLVVMFVSTIAVNAIGVGSQSSVISGLNESDDIAGTYSGTATAIKMDGITLVIPVSVQGSFTVDANGIISGNFSATNHDFSMKSSEPISEGDFSDVEVRGDIGDGRKYTGKISGTLSNGSLSFTCSAYMDSDNNKTKESVFTFDGLK